MRSTRCSLDRFVSPFGLVGRGGGLLLLLMWIVGACNSGGGDSVAPPPAPTLSVGFGLKQLQFTWVDVAGETTYRLLENPDGASGFTQVGANIAAGATSQTLNIGVHRQDWANVSYQLEACNSGGCTASNTVTTLAGMLLSIGYVKASNTEAGDQFGFSVALSSDGATLAVGADLEDSNATDVGGPQGDNSANAAGAVYVYTRSSAGVWSQQAYVKASNTEAIDQFGRSIALSSDGSTLAVGATGEDSNAMGVGGTQTNNAAGSAGAVYVYTRSSAGVWSPQAYVKASNTEGGDLFGFSVALSSDGAMLAVGAVLEDSNATGVDGPQGDNSAGDAGAVYVYTRSSVGVWSQQAYVKASNPEAGDQFGRSIALSSDGSTLAVEAPNEDSNATGVDGPQGDNSASSAGAVYVYTRSSVGVWSQQAYVKASNTEAGDAFGFSVALSSDGSTLAVGATGEASNATGVGGPQGDNSAIQAGAVYVYTRSSVGVWSQQAYVKASNTEAGDGLGGSLALSSDGTTLAVTASGEDSNATGVDGNQGNNSASEAGAVYVYTRSSGGVWSQQAYVKASNTQANDGFGDSLALSSDGTTLAVRASAEDSNATGVGGDQGDNSAGGAGAVYLY